MFNRLALPRELKGRLPDSACGNQTNLLHSGWANLESPSQTKSLSQAKRLKVLEFSARKILSLTKSQAKVYDRDTVEPL